MAGTPFAKSRTALTKWFYAMYLFTTSRHGVPAKELQRQLGVTYKCAWRMGHEIRKYMADVDGDSGLSGHVEMDETYVGGREKNARGRPSKNSKKIAIFGMVERNGNVMTHIIPNASKKSLLPIVKQNVSENSTISTDDWSAYNTLNKLGYKHGIVKHQLNEWVKGIHHTQTIEGFWSQIKRSIRGTHIHVSKKHMAKYLGEFEYRYNMRFNPSLMFDRLLASF
jgi:transposase-like protein